MAKASTPKKKALTKTEVLNRISEATELSKKEISAVFDAMTEEIRKSLNKRGPGQFTIPGLCKIVVVHKPATKERPGKNPQTGEPIVIKAKPARTVVRVRPLKALKAMV